MADLPGVTRCQLCRETAANYVVKPDTVSRDTVSPDSLRGNQFSIMIIGGGGLVAGTGNICGTNIGSSVHYIKHRYPQAASSVSKAIR